MVVGIGIRTGVVLDIEYKGNVAQDAAGHNLPERRNVQGGGIITTVGFSIRVELTQ